MATKKSVKARGANATGKRGNGGSAEGGEGADAGDDGAEGLIVGSAAGEARRARGKAARENADTGPTDPDGAEAGREAIPAAELDRVFTVRSKEKWGDAVMPDGEATPTFADLQAGQRADAQAEQKRNRSK